MKKELMGILVITIFSIFLLSSVSALYINEVMPHSNNTYKNEWVELYNDANYSVNLSGWLIGDISSNDTLINFSIPAKEYALIADNGINNNTGCSNISVACFELPNIGSGLNDGNDTFFIYSLSEVLVDSFTWNESLKSSGKSWSWNISSWNTCVPTPGYINNCSSQNQSNETNESRIILDYPGSVYDNKTNFTVNVRFINFSGLYDLKLDIKKDSSYLNRIWKEEWSSKNSWLDDFVNITSNNFSIDILTILDPNENISGSGTIQVKIRDKNSSLFLSELLNINILDGSEPEEEEEEESDRDSRIDILDWPDEIRFGEILWFDVEVYKGDTSKYAVYYFLEDESGNEISDSYVFYLKKKDSEFEGTLGIKLECLNNEGDYYLVVEGLGERDRKYIITKNCFERPDIDSDEIIEPAVISYARETEKNKEADLVTGSSISDRSFGFLYILPWILSIIGVLFIIYLFVKKFK